MEFKIDESKYLTNMPDSIIEFGLCKTLLVRKEVIHLKHIFTEIFSRKTIQIDRLLKTIDFSLFDYMEFMTNRMRRLHHFSRDYYNTIPDNIVKTDRDRFFPFIELMSGLDNVIVLDFDGVVTSKHFMEKLYHLCFERCNDNVVICSANPTITDKWFIDRNLKLPKEIHSCKGKIAKIKRLLHISKKYDNVFYIDNEETYLEMAWIFGINTFHYANSKVNFYTLKSK